MSISRPILLIGQRTSAEFIFSMHNGLAWKSNKERKMRKKKNEFHLSLHCCSSFFLSVRRVVVQGERTIAKVLVLIAVRERGRRRRRTSFSSIIRPPSTLDICDSWSSLYCFNSIRLKKKKTKRWPAVYVRNIFFYSSI